MMDQFEKNRRKITPKEKAEVWSNIRVGKTASLGSNWFRWGVPVAGLATVLLMVVMVGESPENVGILEQSESNTVFTDAQSGPPSGLRDEVAGSSPELAAVPEAVPALEEKSSGVWSESQAYDSAPRGRTGEKAGDMQKAAPASATAVEGGSEARDLEAPVESSGNAIPEAVGQSARSRRTKEVRGLAPATDSDSDLETESGLDADLYERELDDALAKSVSDRAAESVAQVNQDRATATGEIRGTVRTVQGEPLAWASVVVVGTARGAMSLEDGSFLIKDVPVGVHDVQVLMMGYSDSTMAGVQVVAESSDSVGPLLAFSISATSVGTMAEVEIVADKSAISVAQSVTGFSIGSSEQESLPVNETPESVGLKAGVVTSGGELHFRGGRPGEISVMVDGVPVKDPLQGGSYDAFAPPPLPAPENPTQNAPNDEVYDSMHFQHYGANPLQLTEMDPLSTFAVDVDTGAYTLMRSYVERGSLPDRDSPRVEEYVNYFDPGYAEVTDEDFGIQIDGAPSPFGTGFQLLRVGLQARTIPDEDRLPSNLTFVIDVSGSMDRENRLGLVKSSLSLLLDSLRPNDQIAIVVYGSRAQLVLEPSSLEDDDRIRAAILQLAPNGSTNAEEGLVLGYEVARSMFSKDANNLVILCSDGVANVGRTGSESILDRVQSESTSGIHLASIGFGMGNYNDVLMEQLANKGDGSYYYVDRLAAARRVFQKNLTGTLQVVARDAKIQVEFDPEQVLAYRLIGFENRDVADQDFRNDTVDAGEIGSGHRVTALYEVRLREGAGTSLTVMGSGSTLPDSASRSADRSPKLVDLGRVRLRYAAAGLEAAGQFRELDLPIRRSDFSPDFESSPVRFRLAAVVAEYAEILRHSYWAQQHTLSDLLPHVETVAFYLRRDADVAEFAVLVKKATGLEELLSPEERARRRPVLDPIVCSFPRRQVGQVDWDRWECVR